MYKEVTCLAVNHTENDARETLFRAVDNPNPPDCIIVQPNHIITVLDFLPMGKDLSVAIDYPYGYSETSTRVHAVLAAIKKGAKCIDLTANVSFILNSQTNKFAEDIKKISAICKENDIVLRVIVENRVLNEVELKNIIEILVSRNIEYVVFGTGIIRDDPLDHIIMIQKLSMNYNSIKFISNCNLWLPKHIKNLEQSNIFGIRFNSIQSYLSIFGV